MRISRMFANGSPSDDDSAPDVIVEKELSFQIIGCGMEVHNELGCGFAESVYSRCLEILLRQRGLRVERECPFDVVFHGVEVGTYRADLVVERRIIIEIKSAEKISDVARRQLRNYLAIARLRLGIVLNFGQRLDYSRVLHRVGRKAPDHSRHSRNSHV